MSDNSLSILHLSSIKNWGGGEQQLVNLYRGLLKYTDNQLIIAPESSALAHYCLQHQLKIQSLPQKRGFFYINVIKFLNRLCKNHHFDIIHIHDARMHTAMLFAKLFFKIKASVIVSRKVAFPLKQSWLTRLKYNSKHICKFICISKAVYEAVALEVKNHDKLIIIHDGIEATKFQQAQCSSRLREEIGVSPDVKLIGAACSLNQNKDLFTFINVAKLMYPSDSPIQFLIFGEGPLRAKLEAYAMAQGVQKNIIFMGFRNNLHELLPQLDIFMLTSCQEGAGSVILEAMASQVPVVATRVGGVPEFIVNNETGLLAESGDAARLRYQINRILNNSTFRDKLIHQASQSLSQFTIETMAKKTWDLYCSLTT